MPANPLPPSPIPSTSTLIHESSISKTDLERRKARRKETRRRSRNRKREELGATFSIERTRDNITTRYVQKTGKIDRTLDFQASKVTRRAFVGLQDDAYDATEFSLADLVGPSSSKKFDLLPWDGM